MTARPLLLAAGARDGVADALGEQRAVGEAGDRVVEGLVGELLLEGLALGDVAALSTMPRTASSSSRLVCRISNWRSVPSRWRSEHSRTSVSPPA